MNSRPLASTEHEHVERLLHTDALRIERIVSDAQPSPAEFWYDQPQQEWVVLLKGTATLSFADQELIVLKAGDYLLIPAHLKHRVDQVSEDALWLAVNFT